jgi:hypothetical protein
MAVYQTKHRLIRAARCDELIAVATSAWGNLPTWFRAAYERGDVLIGADRMSIRLDSGGREIACPGDYIACDETEALRAVNGKQFEKTYELAAIASGAEAQG